MKMLPLMAVVPMVLLSANSFAQGRQESYRERDSYRDSYNDRDRGGRYDSGYGDRDRDRYRNTGRRYSGARYAYAAPVVYYPRARPSRLAVGIYNDYVDYGYSSYGYSAYDYYPPVSYRVYRPAPVLRLSLNIGGRGGRQTYRGRRR